MDGEVSEKIRNKKSRPLSIRKKLIPWLQVFFIIFWISASLVIFTRLNELLIFSAERDCREVISQIDVTQQYVRDTLRPVMYDLVDEDDFIPETMSTTFIARDITERFVENNPQYIFKFATTNPTNEVNLANVFETELIEMFSENPLMEEWVGTFQHDGVSSLGVALPIRFDESCSRCHGDPSNAPASLITRYGDEGGFNLSEDDVAIKWVSVEIDSYTLFAKLEAIILSILAAIFFFGLYLLTSRLIERHVLKPLSVIRDGIISVGHGDIDCFIQLETGDEFEELANTFNIMAEKNREAHETLQHQVAERTEKLNNRLTEVEMFNKTMIGRESRMIELKKEINSLLVRQGKEPKYEIMDEKEVTEAAHDRS